jgi:hypothetical protein
MRCGKKKNSRPHPHPELTMNLPNYFLVDLPAEAGLSPDMLNEACQTLKRNREQYLVNRTTSNLVETFCALAAQWLDPNDPFRNLALELGPDATGFSRATIDAGLNAFFREFTPPNFQRWLEQEFGHPERLDALVSSSTESREKRAALARGPGFLVHVTAGNLPNSSWMSIVQGFLVRSAQFVKCASGNTLFPRLFAHSLYQMEPKLGACLELAQWPGGNVPLEEALFSQAECITATGTTETIASIRGRVPAPVRFLSYDHRVSFGFVSRDGLPGWDAPNVLARVAADIAAWDQSGCLSPHVIYVQTGGEMGPETFAENLAGELEKLEQKQPRGALSPEESAAIAARRGFYEIRAAHSPGTKNWWSRNSTAWTVIYDSDPLFQISCLNRFIHVKGVGQLREALRAADSVRGKVSTVGIASAPESAPELAHQLAAWGVTRVCPLGRMQLPPLSWRHDGRPSLNDLVTWTDWELEKT